MVKLDKIYTKGGDKGQTSLGDGSRRPKYDVRVAAYGTVDETNAVIGLARTEINGPVDTLLGRIQNDLFDLGADLCTPEDGARSEGALRMGAGQVADLEAAIDEYNEALAPLRSFILPGGSKASAWLHMARTVSRRAERDVIELSEAETINPEAVKYLNRLSDLMFVLSRHCNQDGSDDVLWVPGANR